MDNFEVVTRLGWYYSIIFPSLKNLFAGLDSHSLLSSHSDFGGTLEYM